IEGRDPQRRCCGAPATSQWIPGEPTTLAALKAVSRAEDALSTGQSGVELALRRGTYRSPGTSLTHPDRGSTSMVGSFPKMCRLISPGRRPRSYGHPAVNSHAVAPRILRDP